MLASIGLSAATLSPEEALQRLGSSGARKAAGLSASQPMLLSTATNNDVPVYYVFGDGKTTMFVGADDVAAPLLGYVDNPAFRLDDMPPAMVAWLQEYSNEIKWAIDHSADAAAEQPEAGIEGVSAVMGYRAAGKRKAYANISPLLSTQWDQGSPYNDQCPMFQGERVASGCVATAMAQAMYWHKWPAAPTGYVSYNWEAGNQTLSMNMNGVTFDWNNMNLTYTAANPGTTAQRQAVATLMKACGYSVSMNYNIGANGGSGAAPCAVTAGLVDNMGYDAGIEYKYRRYFPVDVWDDMLVESLKENGPIVYAGFGSGGGHCFVFDGCRTDGTFHVNWGWSGASDGYFRTSALDPNSLGIGGGGGGGFSKSQGAIFGMKRPAGGTKPESYIGTDNGLYLTITGTRVDISALGGAYYINCGGYPAFFSLSMAIEDASGNTTYVGEEEGENVLPNWGWTGFYYELPNLADGDYKIYPAYRISKGTWHSVRFPYGACSYYKIRVSGGKASIIGTGSNTPTGEIYSISLNVTNIPAFNPEKSSTIGTNIKCTYPSHQETIIPHICTREGNTYYFKCNFPAVNVNLSYGDNPVNFTGTVTCKAGDYYLIFCDANNTIINSPLAIKVVGEGGGSGKIECYGNKFSSDLVRGTNVTLTMNLENESPNAQTVSAFSALKSKTNDKVVYGDIVDFSMIAREKSSRTYTVKIPADFPLGKAEFSVIRSSEAGYLVMPMEVEVVATGGGGGDTPDPTPGDEGLGDKNHVIRCVAFNVSKQIKRGTTLNFTAEYVNTSSSAATLEGWAYINSTVDNNKWAFQPQYTLTLAGNERVTRYFSMDVPEDMPLGEADFGVLRMTEPSGYTVKPFKVTIVEGSPEPTPGPTPDDEGLGDDKHPIKVTRIDMNKNIHRNGPHSFTLEFLNTSSSTQTIKPWAFINSNVDPNKWAFQPEFSVTLAGGERKTESYTINVPADMPLGSARFAVQRSDIMGMAVKDFDVNIVEEAEPDPNDPVANRIICTDISFRDLVPGETASYTLKLKNPSASAQTVRVRMLLMSSVNTDKYVLTDWFDISMAAKETASRTFYIDVPADMPVGEASVSMPTDVTGWQLVPYTVVEVKAPNAQCPIVLNDVTFNTKITLGTTISFTLHFENKSNASHSLTAFSYITCNGESLYMIPYINETFAPYEKKSVTLNRDIKRDFPSGPGTFSVINTCEGCTVDFMLIDHPITVEEFSGVEDILYDANGDAEYYNLQGLRVSEPLKGHIYIVRKDGKTSKVRY